MGSPTVPLVAIVDDESPIRETVGLALRRDGYRVESYAEGLEAWTAFDQALPDLVILDILMPGIDGLELCRRLRSRSAALPIIFLTSRDEEFDRVLGLELGADDYLCKPFSMRELTARVKVLFRRAALNRGEGATEFEELLQAGPLSLDLNRYQATWDGHRIDLTVTEFRILLALARHPGHVKTREQLVSEGYPHDTYVSDRTIDTHIKRLRRKLAQVDSEFDAIDTVYGLGYRLRPA
jgi:DNA-binding response OmpR family regulator